MSNNKQSGNQVPDVRKMVSSVEWYIIERHNIEIQSRLGKISSTQYDEQLIKIEEQAKAMHKEEVINATIYGDRFEGCYGLDSYQYYEKTFGGSNE